MVQIFTRANRVWAVFKPLDRFLANSRSYRSPKARPLPAYNRFGQATGHLSNIREESVDFEGSRLPPGDEVSRDYNSNTLREDEYNDIEDEDDMADWDEESTLVAMLHDEWVYAHFTASHNTPACCPAFL